MTPEREKLIRECWAQVSPALKDELKAGKRLGIFMAPPIRAADLARPWDVKSDAAVDRLMVACVFREFTLSAVCEGLELEVWKR